MPYPLLWKLAIPRFLFRLSVLRGTENIPPAGPFLVVSNHISYLDPPIIAAVVAKRTGEQIYFIAYQAIYRVFGGRYLGKRLGMVPVDPKNKSASLDTLRSYLEQGKIVGIFPEASRSGGTQLSQGKTGAARLALWTKCPVIPIGYRGPETPRARDALKLFFSRNPNIRMTIGAPLDLSSYYHQEITHELLEAVTRTMMRTIGSLCGKEYPY